MFANNLAKMPQYFVTSATESMEKRRTVEVILMKLTKKYLKQ
jgi:hypothetical protein